MAREDGDVWASDLRPVAEACGTRPEQLRSCLRRLVAEGLFTREGSGAQARYPATPLGIAALGRNRERIRRAWALDRGAPGWDGRWHLVAFAVPESDRPARDAFRELLRRLGGAPLQGGLYVSPHAWDAEVEAGAKELGVEGCVTLASSADLAIGGVAEAREIARRLWPLAELEASYRTFVDRYRDVPRRLAEMGARHEALSDAAFLPGALAMAADFLPPFGADPLLPRELLPDPWPGRRARELLLRSRRLALGLREAQGRPGLFRVFDETLEDTT
jgi:phenylacetic acid degradation operon negative regulatory protein